MAHGTLARCAFERCALTSSFDCASPPPPQRLLAAATTPQLAGAAAKRASVAAPAAAAVAGADNAADALFPRPQEAGALKRRSSPSVGGTSDVGAGGVTLGERLRLLELAASGGGDVEMGDTEQHVHAASAAFASGAPRADSLAVLLAQALRSGDAPLLEKVLSVNDAAVAAATCRRLPPELALQLLQAALVRLQARPARGAQLARWLRATLLAHAAYLAAAPRAAPLLAALFALLESRLELHRPLSQLAGRLELLLEAARAGGAAEALDIGVEYEEPADGEEELEDARGGRGSDADAEDESGDEPDAPADDAAEEGEEDTEDEASDS